MKTMNRVAASAAVGCLLLTLPMIGLAIEGVLNAQVASKIIEGCVTHAKAKMQSHSIAVYDTGGNPVALLRMDGSTAGATEFAMQKAAAVAHWGFSTADMNAAVKETLGFGSAPRVATVPGGIPVYSGDGRPLIGAVGVSGEAPQDDAACAAAGVTAAGLSLVRKAAR